MSDHRLTVTAVGRQFTWHETVRPVDMKVLVVNVQGSSLRIQEEFGPQLLEINLSKRGSRYSSDSDDPDIHKVRIGDKGNHSWCAKVDVQGVPMYGIVDSGADITIIGGQMFKTVAVVAKLRK